MSLQLPAFVPRTVPAAKRALAAMIRDIDAEQTYAALRKIERMAEAIKVLYREVDDVRRAAELTIALALHRIGDELAKAPAAKGTRGQLAGRDASGAAHRAAPENGAATLVEQVGSQKRGLRLKRLAAIERPALTRVIAVIQGAGRDATTSAILKHVAGEQTRERRAESRAATPIPDGMDLRIGDCRTVLADIRFLAIKRNAKHGMILSQEDKRALAIDFCLLGRDANEVCAVLSIARQTWDLWTADARARRAETQRETILDLHLRCWTEEQIAKQVGMPQQTVSKEIEGFSKSANFGDSTIFHDFEADDSETSGRRVYDVWNFAKADNEVRHFGNVLQRTGRITP